ncbi:MAG: 50S ribosomal protein L25 [Acidobacteriia bacterium]|nr:50S ribosomal protein L25 [Terriglobia bacterium]
MKAISVSAKVRSERGSRAARRVRRQGLIPAVVYGASKQTLSLLVNPKEILSILNSETGHNSIFTLEIEGHGKQNVLIKDWLYEPVKSALLHADFYRIAMDKPIEVTVPIRTVGEAQGVKLQGGILEIVLREVEIQCLPADIPDHIDVDVTELVFGTNIRVGDLKVDSKIKILSDPNLTVAHLTTVREEKAAAEVVEGAAPEAPAEPEVIKKGKIAAEGEEAPEEAEKGEKK